ncbi:hypothetical protein ACI79G_00545 [Geodermatophilus sp. SYSU D00779]
MRVPTRLPRPGPALADDGAAGLATANASRAGWSGIAFTLLLVAAALLLGRVPGLTASDAEYSDFYAGGGDAMVAIGLYLVPFAGIAAPWHMIATRTLLQVRRPGSWADATHWLHLAACVVFVALLFAGAAASGAAALVVQFSDAPPLTPDVTRGLTATGYTLVFVYAVRAAGMYMLTTTGLAQAAGVIPRPVALTSYALAAVLLASTTFHPVILLVLPAWVLLMSVLLLVRRPTGDPS